MPSSSITVAIARASLQSNAQGFSNVGMDATFIPALNQVIERLIQSGKWQGMIEQVVFGLVFGNMLNYITLPWQFVSILKSRYGCWPGVAVWSQFHEFMECGPGEMTNQGGWASWQWQLIDMGDQFCTQVDITTAGPIQVASTSGDNGQVVRIFGINAATGQPVYDTLGNPGITLTLAAPSVTTSIQFSAITGFQKPLTKGAVNLFVAPPAATSYQIATYQPVETIPQYHRYKTGAWTPPEGSPNIVCLCQRRFVPVNAETDYVYPGSIGALKAGLQALNYENLDREADAQIQWTKATALMNALTHSTRGGARVEVETNLFGDGAGMPWTN